MSRVFFTDVRFYMNVLCYDRDGLFELGEGSFLLSLGTYGEWLGKEGNCDLRSTCRVAQFFTRESLSSVFVERRETAAFSGEAECMRLPNGCLCVISVLMGLGRFVWLDLEFD